MSIKPNRLYYCKNCGKYYSHHKSMTPDGKIRARIAKSGRPHTVIRTHTKCK